jgi:hypothetical protein
MSKGYVKDKNGKYRLVDKTQEPIVLVNQQQPLTMEEIDKRLKKVEAVLFSSL